MLDLSEISFKGTFQRNPEEVVEELRAVQKSPQDFTPGSLDRVKRDQRAYEFEMKVFYHDPETGLFIARGFDMAGTSGIYGKIVRSDKFESSMTFSKGYPRDSMHLTNGGAILDQTFRRFNYSGTADMRDDILVCQGQYTMPGHGAHMNGTWELTQIR